MTKFLIIVLIFITAVFAACTTEENQNNDAFFGHEYFPIEQGNAMIYKITDIYIDKPSNINDTSIYYIKEVIDIPIIDNENDTAYRVERFYKSSPNDNWTIHSVWTIKRTELTAEKVEENLRFIKIRFPIKQEYSWDGNIFNELESKEFRISSFNTPYSINDYSFDSCLTVVQDSSASLIHKDLAYEVYAYRFGLVYKEATYINSQEVIFELPVEERITTGTIFKQELIEIEFPNY